jgi:hypothetical protein
MENNVAISEISRVSSDIEYRLYLTDLHCLDYTHERAIFTTFLIIFDG